MATMDYTEMTTDQLDQAARGNHYYRAVYAARELIRRGVPAPTIGVVYSTDDLGQPKTSVVEGYDAMCRGSSRG